MPGIDPQHVNVEVAGSTLHIHAEQPADGSHAPRPLSVYEQTLELPQFLDVDKLRAAYRHGMLQLTLPLKESVKPRRIAIHGVAEEEKQLTAA
jgi:HSP20 family protein